MFSTKCQVQNHRTNRETRACFCQTLDIMSVWTVLYQMCSVQLESAESVLLDFSFQHQKLIEHVKKNVDTVFSSVAWSPHLWKKRGKFLSPFNFNPYKRKRRQNIYSINETGSFYIVKKDSFLKAPTCLNHSKYWCFRTFHVLCSVAQTASNQVPKRVPK